VSFRLIKNGHYILSYLGNWSGRRKICIYSWCRTDSIWSVT